MADFPVVFRHVFNASKSNCKFPAVLDQIIRYGFVETLVKSIDVRGIVFHNAQNCSVILASQRHFSNAFADTPSCGIRQQTYTTTSMLFVEHFYRAQVFALQVKRHSSAKDVDWLFLDIKR